MCPCQRTRWHGRYIYVNRDTLPGRLMYVYMRRKSERRTRSLNVSVHRASHGCTSNGFSLRTTHDPSKMKRASKGETKTDLASSAQNPSARKCGNQAPRATAQKRKLVLAQTKMRVSVPIDRKQNTPGFLLFIFRTRCPASTHRTAHLTSSVCPSACLSPPPLLLAARDRLLGLLGLLESERGRRNIIPPPRKMRRNLRT